MHQSVAYKTEDEITTLPGWDAPLPSRMFAGHVSAGVEGQYHMYEHYFFAESEGNPATDPVIVWTNGGPGASSFFGMFVELGPFYVDGNSMKTDAFNKTGVPTLFRNEETWTKAGSVLILNSPPPVGYSYCDPAGQSGDGYSCGNWNDTRTAKHNAAFIENWVKEFPQFANNEWYFIGESYAGIYVPTLVRELIFDTALGKLKKPVVDVKGFAVGDGCVGTEVLCGGNGPGYYYWMEFFHGHGQISDKMYGQVHDACTLPELYGYGHPITKGCEMKLTEMTDSIGGYYAYNLYDACWYENSLEPPKGAAAEVGSSGQSSPLMGALNDYPCGGPAALFKWVRHPDVKKALHVAPDANFFSGDNGVGFNYTLTEKNLLPFYKFINEKTDLRVLIYNGDTDPAINSFVTQNWTSSLNFPIKEEWRPWTLDGKSYMGGYVTRYENDFDFLTIRGSGHMVPEFKPKVALHFLKRWLANEEYDKFVKQPSGKMRAAIVEGE